MKRVLYEPVHDDGRGAPPSPYPLAAYNWKGEQWGEWIPVQGILVDEYQGASIAGLLAELLSYAPSWAIERHGLDGEVNEAIDLLKGRESGDNDG